MNPLLFVYGTLMSHTGTEKARQLMAEAESLGPASIAGTLYKITWYPGLVEGEGTVHGEVFRLRDPKASLIWLDAYEGIVPDAADGNREEYERVERAVRLASGERLTTWVYLYRADVTGCETVASGRWMT